MQSALCRREETEDEHRDAGRKGHPWTVQARRTGGKGQEIHSDTRLEYGRLLVELLDTHRAAVVLNATEGEKVAEATTEVAVVHRVDDGVEDL